MKCIIFWAPVFSPPDRVTRKPRGFTFIQFRRPEDAEDAVRGMDGRVSSIWDTLLQPDKTNGPNFLCFTSGLGRVYVWS